MNSTSWRIRSNHLITQWTAVLGRKPGQYAPCMENMRSIAGHAPNEIFRMKLFQANCTSIGMLATQFCSLQTLFTTLWTLVYSSRTSAIQSYSFLSYCSQQARVDINRLRNRCGRRCGSRIAWCRHGTHFTCTSFPAHA